MRKGTVIAVALALALTFALWFAAKVERNPLHREKSRGKVPEVLVGRDLGEAQEAPVRVEGETAQVRCSYDGENAPGSLVAIGPDAVNGNGLTLALEPGSWSILWHPEKGRAVSLGSIEAEPDEVYTCRLADGGFKVDGTVRSTHGGALEGIDVQICGERATTNANGEFSGVARSRHCSVRAVYTDGLLSRRSDPQIVEAFESHALEFLIDDRPIAGMGIGFRMTNQGARVTNVHPDTPAEEADLREGDVIVSVNGTSTSGLQNDAFVALGTGDEGSLVNLEIERDGERRTVSFRRRRLTAGDTG